jgi:hypothetical protein
MTDLETLRYARNILLKLHKSLIDFERAAYEQSHGEMNAGQFLNALLDDQFFSWLRKFSMLIVEIDEMFDLNDGISAEMTVSSLQKIRELIDTASPDQDFRARYRNALQSDPETAGVHAQLQGLLKRN